MKHTFILLFSLITISSIAQVKNVDVNDFEKMISELNSNEILIDVRSKKELKDGFIPGMIHIDFHSDDFKTQIKELDKSKTYYVYCAAGGRSFKAAKDLEEIGIKSIYNLNGGIIAWNKAGKKIDN